MDYIMKNLHFIFTHVPIALLIFSFIFDVAALLLKKKEWHSAGMLCLVVGALGAIAGVLTGPEMMMQNANLKSHQFYAQLTMFASIVLAAVRVGLLVWKKLELGRNVIFLVASLVVVILVSYTGHLGGKMVHRDMQGGPGMMQGGPGDGGPSGNGGQGQGQRPGAGQGQGPGQGAPGAGG